MATATVELRAESSQIRSATNDLKNLQRQGQNTDRAVQQTNARLGGLGRNAGQAGIQIQQLVGQIQGGTSPFVALSQQAADLGFVLGVPLAGAIISIGAVIAGSLIPNLLDSTDNTEELTEALRKLEEQQGLTGNQAVFLASQTQEEIRAKQERIEALEAETKAEQELIKARTTAGIGTDTSQFAVPRSATENQERYSDAIEESTTVIERNRAEIDKLRAEIQQQEEQLARYSDGAQEALEVQQRLAETTVDLAQKVEIARVAQEQGELAATQLALAYKLGLESAEELPLQLQLYTKTLYENEQAQRAATEAAREQLQVDREIAKAREAFMRLQSDLAVDTAEDPAIARLEQQLQQRLELIEEYRLTGELAEQDARQAYLDAEEAFQNQVTALQEKAAQERNRIADQETQYREQQLQNTLTATGDIFGNLAEIARAGGEETFAAYKVLASAQAGISAALAILQVYADPNIPTQLKFPLSATIAGITGAQVAQIAAASYGGARALGGQVRAGGSYLVGERGPELITASSMGRVTPFNQLMRESREGGGGEAPIVNINNYGGGEARVERARFSEADRRWVLDVVVGDIDSYGRTVKAIGRRTTASTRTNS